MLSMRRSWDCEGLPQDQQAEEISQMAVEDFSGQRSVCLIHVLKPYLWTSTKIDGTVRLLFKLAGELRGLGKGFYQKVPVPVRVCQAQTAGTCPPGDLPNNLNYWLWRASFPFTFSGASGDLQVAAACVFA